MTRHAPDWSAIDTVLLDLDGTLLDLSFDNFLWLQRIPALYAEQNALSIADGHATLAPRFRAWRGKLEWYCIDFWSRELGLDIAALHREYAARISWLPGARDFLLRLRARGKRLVLCTNSHPVTLAIKHEQTRVLDLLDAGFSSHRFGAPKEQRQFWLGLQAEEPFDPARTLFVDDRASVLRAARDFGLGFLCAISEPDSSRSGNHYDRLDAGEFYTVEGVRDL
jgi:putative hydrolase of the HAD superfamily